MKKQLSFISPLVLLGLLTVTPLSMVFAQDVMKPVEMRSVESVEVQSVKSVQAVKLSGKTFKNISPSNVKFVSPGEVESINKECSTEICVLKAYQQIDVKARVQKVTSGIVSVDADQKISEDSVAKILALLSNIINRAYYGLNKFDNIVDRIDSRMIADSINSEELAKMTSEARTKIADTRALLGKISENYEDSVLKGNPSDFFPEMRVVISEFKDIQGLLFKAVSML